MHLGGYDRLSLDWEPCFAQGLLQGVGIRSCFIKDYGNQMFFEIRLDIQNTGNRFEGRTCLSGRRGSDHARNLQSNGYFAACHRKSEKNEKHCDSSCQRSAIMPILEYLHVSINTR